MVARAGGYRMRPETRSRADSRAVPKQAVRWIGDVAGGSRRSGGAGRNGLTIVEAGRNDAAASFGSVKREGCWLVFTFEKGRPGW